MEGSGTQPNRNYSSPIDRPLPVRNPGENEEEKKEQEIQRKRQRQQMFARKMSGYSEKNEDVGPKRVNNRALSIGKKKESAGEERFTFNTMFLLYFVAGIADFFSLIMGIVDYFIPELGTGLTDLLIVPPATLTLYLIYKFRGVDFNNTKVLQRFWYSALLKFVPFISFLPEFCLNVFLVTTIVKLEDKIKMKG